MHRGAVAAARRAGIAMEHAVPAPLGAIPVGTQVVTVCDRAHEELDPAPDWWHWSIPDPVPDGRRRAFDAAVGELRDRIASVLGERRAA